MNFKILAISVLLVNLRTSLSKRYEQFALFNLVPTDQEHLRFLQNLEQQKYIDLMFWKKPSRMHEDVQLIVNPNDKDLFVERAQHFKLQVQMLIPDIQEAFDKQFVKRYLRLRPETYTWNSYHVLEDIYQWMADITLKYPSVLELTSIGKSVEGRDIYALTLKKKRGRSVIVEGGIHGHEWLSTEYVLYLANHLLHANSSKYPRLKEISEKYTWHFIPLLNPDGYEYTHTQDRLWRKNRRVMDKDIGVDLNRNFPYSFGSYGASFDQNDENFCGTTSLSEPETRALSNFIASKKNGLRFYFAFHAYGQKIIIPYADRVKHLENYGEMENYSKQAIMKIYRRHGIKYRVGTIYDTLGTRISGNTASWVKKDYKVKYVFTIQLRDNGTFGYALPPNQIEPACDEGLTGMLEIMTAKPRKVILFSQSSRIFGNYLLVFLLNLLSK